MKKSRVGESCFVAIDKNFQALIRRQAGQVFGSKARGDAWLARPRVEFGGLAALECAGNEAGYRKVKASLDRIDQGYAC